MKVSLSPLALSVLLLILLPAVAFADEEIEQQLDHLEMDLRAEARELWRALDPLLAGGGPVADDAVHAFLDEYDAAEVCVEDLCRAVRLLEVEEATAWRTIREQHHEPATIADEPPPTRSSPTREVGDPAPPLRDERPAEELRRTHLGLAVEAASAKQGLIAGPEITWHRRRLYSQLRIGLGTQPFDDLLTGLASLGESNKDLVQEIQESSWMSAQLQARLAVEAAPDRFRVGLEGRIWDETIARPDHLFEEARLEDWNSRGVAAGPYLAGGFVAGPAMVRFSGSYQGGLTNFMPQEDVQVIDETSDWNYTRWGLLEHQFRLWTDLTLVFGGFYTGLELGTRVRLRNLYVRKDLGMDPLDTELLFSMRAGFAF